MMTAPVDGIAAGLHAVGDRVEHDLQVRPAETRAALLRDDLSTLLRLTSQVRRAGRAAHAEHAAAKAASR